MKNRIRPAIDPEQACTCARPVRSGRFNLGREVCIGCNGFIVESRDERLDLELLERQRERKERARANGTPPWM